MLKRIILSLAIILALLAIFAGWRVHTLRGLLFLICIGLATCFAVSGEEVVGKLPSIRRIRAKQNEWGAWNLDINKLFSLRAHWDDQRVRDPGLSEPTRMRTFCSTHVENLLDAAGSLKEQDKLRPISDVIRLVSYPESRLARITHELRLYAGLFSIVSLFQLLGPDPQVAIMLISGKFLQACNILGQRPLEFFAGVELTIFAVFATRLLGEISNLRQYIN